MGNKHGKLARIHRNTSLHEAVEEGRADVVQVLIDAGADIEEKDSEGRTPLLLACWSGYLDAVKVLVQAGAELRVADHNGRTCLTLASCEGHTETVRYLVSLGQVDVDQGGGDRSGNTALHEAVGQNHADVVQVLIDAGADIEKKDSSAGRTPLFHACKEGYLDIVKVLVQAGASVTDHNGRTCLTAAVEEVHTETVLYLVGLGRVDVDQVGRTEGDWTALHKAVLRNDVDMVQVLIDAGADIEKKTFGCSPLLLVCESDVNDVVKVLVRAGADVGARDEDGRTCLMIAAGRSTKIVKSLLCMAEVGVDLVDAKHWTALHHAVSSKDEAVVQVLIDAGADVEAKSELVCSPLMMACRAGEVHIVRMLLKAGARLHIQGNGNIRFDAAARYPKSYAAKVQELIDSGARIEKWDDRGPSPLVCACMGENRDIVNLLVEAGAELRVTEHIEELSQHFEATAGDRKKHKIQKVTCLITAAEEGGTETVRYLMVGVEQEVDQAGVVVDADVADIQADVTNTAALSELSQMDSAAKKRLREKLEPIRAAWEHMAKSRQHPEAEQHPVDSDVSRIDVTNRTGSNTLCDVADMQEAVQKELIQRFTDCTDSEQKELLRNKLVSMRATWEHMAESRQQPEAEPQPVDADVSRTDVTNTRGCNTLRGVADMQEEVQKELIQRFTDCTDSAEKELLRNRLLSMRATWEHMAESRQQPEAEPQPVDADVSRTDVMNTRGSNTLRQVVNMQEEVQKELIQRFTDCTDSAEKELLCNKLLSMRATWEHMAESRQHPEAEPQPVDVDVSRTDVMNTRGCNTLRGVADMQEEVQKELIQRFTDCTDSAEKVLLRNRLLSMRATWERQHPEAEPQPVDVDVSRTDVMNTRGCNTLRGVADMQEEVQNELIQRFTDCTDSAEKELLRNKLLSLRATWEHMAESRQHPEAEPQPVDVDVSRTDVTNRTGSNTLREVVSMQEAVQKELIQRFTDCTDSAEKELLRNKLVSMRATWEHMAESRQQPEAEPQPVDADVSRTDVTNTRGCNTLRGVADMQEEVQKELIQRFTDCTDSAEKVLLRNRLLSMRATWEHMAESRQHPEAEPQPVDVDVSRTDVMNTRGCNTLRGVADMQEEVQNELIQRFTDCTDSAEKELLRNKLLSLRATWEHMAESRQHPEAEPQPVDVDVSRTDVTNRTGSNTLREVVSMQEAVQKELIQRFTDCTDSAEKELLRNTLLSMRATWEHMAESRQQPEAEPQPVDADVSRTDVMNTRGSNTLRQVVNMQEEVQKELIQRFTDCTDSAEKELLRNKLLSMRATWEHMAESRQHPEAEPQPVDVDVSRTDVMNTRGCNTLRGVADMQEEVQKELIQRFTDCTDSAEKVLLRNRLLSMRATWERQHPEAEPQPVDVDVSRTDVMNTRGCNTLRGVADMQEEVQNELIQRFTDCTDSAEKELLRNKLLSLRATWEHMAESRQHPEAEPQPVDVDVSRTDVTNRTGSNTLREVVSMQEAVQKELIQRFTDCTDSAEKELLRNTLLSMRATWEHMAESRQHPEAEPQPVEEHDESLAKVDKKLGEAERQREGEELAKKPKRKAAIFAEERPCSHNSWDNVRSKAGVITLRCRQCQGQFKGHPSLLVLCKEFQDAMTCSKENCTSLHVFKHKETLAERSKRFGRLFGDSVIKPDLPKKKKGARDGSTSPASKGTRSPNALDLTASVTATASGTATAGLTEGSFADKCDKQKHAKAREAVEASSLITEYSDSAGRCVTLRRAHPSMGTMHML